MAEPNHHIEASDLCCVRSELNLFQNLRFSVSDGEVLQIRGANGSGKSSLLRILCSLLQPDLGEVRWNDRDIQSVRADYLGQLCYLGHLHGIKDDLTANENLVFSALIDGIEHDDGRIDDALRKMNLLSHRDFPARKLSAGQKRRLALSRFLLTKAPIWLLDEPFTALDDAGKSFVTNLIEEHLAEGGLCIVATHEALQSEKLNIKGLEL